MLPRGRRDQPPGLTIWQTREELERARRRQLMPVLLLAAIAVLLCVPWLSVETDGEGTLSGWLALELIVLVPLVFGARRVNKVSALIARSDAYSQEDQAAEAEALRYTDESIWRAAAVAASLEDGPAWAQAQEAMASAERAALVLRPLVRRRTQLRHLLHASRSKSATATLRTTVTACEGDIDRLESQIADVTASVALLVDAASDAMFEHELQRLRQATDDVQALVSAFEDIAAVEDAAGLRPGWR